MKTTLQRIYDLSRALPYSEFETLIKSELTGRPVTELVEGEVEIEMKHKPMKYKKGDTVTITDNITDHDFKIGDKVKIIGLYPDPEIGTYYQATLNLSAESVDDENQWWLVCDKELKLQTIQH